MSIDTIDINLRRRRNLGVLVVVSGFWEVSGLSGPRDVFFRVVWARDIRQHALYVTFGKIYGVSRQ